MYISIPTRCRLLLTAATQLPTLTTPTARFLAFNTAPPHTTFGNQSVSQSVSVYPQHKSASSIYSRNPRTPILIRPNPTRPPMRRNQRDHILSHESHQPVYIVRTCSPPPPPPSTARPIPEGTYIRHTRTRTTRLSPTPYLASPPRVPGPPKPPNGAARFPMQTPQRPDPTSAFPIGPSPRETSASAAKTGISRLDSAGWTAWRGKSGKRLCSMGVRGGLHVARWGGRRC
ncbi:hypothetical protein PMIN01_13009 [Paraphaeosphaeria minitans]|uniref:Uncharacterized protein n=1 Tax=Paraphaeosphaeria minitans TaxID=565426 RepID=A0A9P6G7T5_9PLEO|nr:hypothetical protein PMIN01_13009 [Paraphaeosphaeria minitans]